MHVRRLKGSVVMYCAVQSRLRSRIYQSSRLASRPSLLSCKPCMCGAHVHTPTHTHIYNNTRRDRYGQASGQIASTTKTMQMRSRKQALPRSLPCSLCDCGEAPRPRATQHRQSNARWLAGSGFSWVVVVHFGEATMSYGQKADPLSLRALLRPPSRFPC